MEALTKDHKSLFTSWNALREYADGQVAEINELKQSLEAQLQERVAECNSEAQAYLPLLKAIEQKKANVEAEMHSTEVPFPTMTLGTEDLTTAAENFLTEGNTDPITINNTDGEVPAAPAVEEASSEA